MSFGDFAIAPSTTVTLCAGVPLAKGSEDTFIFGSAGEQAGKISSYALQTFTNITYQRNTRNVIRLGLPMGVSGADSALRANYLMFNNTAFEGKTIYAFVDSVDYVNNNTIDVTFTIDAMQTFMFDYELHECYVEREHSDQDTVGYNCVPEEFGSFDYLVQDENKKFSDNSVPSASTYLVYYIDNANSAVNGEIDPETKAYSACTVHKIPAGQASSESDLNTFLTARFQDGDTVTAIWLLPNWMLNYTGLPDRTYVNRPTKFVQDLEEYTPKNNKLFTAPYTFVRLSNHRGTTKDYYFEDKTTGAYTMDFYAWWSRIPEPAMYVCRWNVKGATDNGIGFSDFPSFPFTEDTFSTWWAANKQQMQGSGVSSVISTITNTISGAMVGYAVSGMNPIGAIVGGSQGFIGGTMNTVQKQLQYNDMKSVPDKFCGGHSGSAAMQAMDYMNGITIYVMGLAPRDAKIVDDYFTMYGYATKRVKVPNRDVRPRFCYTKTVGCTIYGTVPAPFAEEIQTRYNNGVRFWKSSATIGDYSTSNAV